MNDILESEASGISEVSDEEINERQVGIWEQIKNHPRVLSGVLFVVITIAFAATLALGSSDNSFEVQGGPKSITPSNNNSQLVENNSALLLASSDSSEQNFYENVLNWANENPDDALKYLNGKFNNDPKNESEKKFNRVQQALVDAAYRGVIGFERKDGQWNVITLNL